MKILKALGLLVVIGAVFALGYWRGQNALMTEHTPAADSSAKSGAATPSMEGQPGEAATRRDSDSIRRDPTDGEKASDGRHRHL
jgi:hypothetical protein